MHHLYQYSGILKNAAFGVVFQMMGYYSVGMFFFLSGYGLMSSVRHKGQTYVRGFLIRRLLPYYCIIVFLTALYTAYDLIMGLPFKWTDVALSLLFGNTVIMNGWYLQTLLVLYAAFYLVFSVFKNTRTRILSITAFCGLYCLACFLSGLSETWYQGVFTFPFGMLFCAARRKLDPFFEGGKIRTIALSFIVFCAFVALRFVDALRIPALMVSEPVFAVLTVSLTAAAVSLNGKILVNAVTRALGAISLEIYVYQGMFLVAFHSDKLYIGNPWLYIAAVTLCTVVFSMLLHPLTKLFYSKIGGKVRYG